MKKQILLIFSFVIATFAMAQQPPVMGIRGGISSAGMRGAAVENLNSVLDYSKGMVATKNRTGMFIGTYTSLPVSETFSIEPAIYYSQKGYEMQGDLKFKVAEILGINTKVGLNSQYIDVPLVLKGNFNGFQVFAGPQISYLLNANMKAAAGVFGINLINKKIDVTEQFNRWDAGITGGIGYKFSNGFNITAAYDHGLSRADAGQNLNSYNHAVKVGIGVEF